MENDISGPTIYQPFDSPLRWMVESRSHPNSRGGHLCDLGAYGGRGICTCEDFQCRVGPAVKKGLWRTCWHLRVARERYTNWSIRRDMAADQNAEHDRTELGI
jgi:hypothetical protein